MLKKYFLITAAAILLFGCRGIQRPQFQPPAKLEQKDAENAKKMSQMLGIKHERTLLLDADELEFALQYSEYFAESVKMLGFSTVAVPFVSAEAADVSECRGEELLDFVMYLNSKSLKTVYLLRESCFVNRQNADSFIEDKENPYEEVLTNLKKFWKELPGSAEMPTVIIVADMNRIAASDAKEDKTASDKLMFVKSVHFFTECRKILNLEQLILLVDERVVRSDADKKSMIAAINSLLTKCDALGVDFAPAADADAVLKQFELLREAKDNGCIFVSVPSYDESVNSYSKWLEYLELRQKNAAKYSSYAGMLIQNWNKLNRIWRQAK